MVCDIFFRYLNTTFWNIIHVAQYQRTDGLGDGLRSSYRGPDRWSHFEGPENGTTL